MADLGGYWDEITFQETRDTGFLLGRLEELWRRVPRYKPLSVGVVLLDLVGRPRPLISGSLSRAGARQAGEVLAVLPAGRPAPGRAPPRAIDYSYD